MERSLHVAQRFGNTALRLSELHLSSIGLLAIDSSVLWPGFVGNVLHANRFAIRLLGLPSARFKAFLVVAGGALSWPDWPAGDVASQSEKITLAARQSPRHEPDKISVSP